MTDTPSPQALAFAASWAQPARRLEMARALDAFAREAVERERERCARVAETEPASPPPSPPRDPRASAQQRGGRMSGRRGWPIEYARRSETCEREIGGALKAAKMLP